MCKPSQMIIFKDEESYIWKDEVKFSRDGIVNSRNNNFGPNQNLHLVRETVLCLLINIYHFVFKIRKLALGKKPNLLNFLRNSI